MPPQLNMQTTWVIRALLGAVVVLHGLNLFAQRMVVHPAIEHEASQFVRLFRVNSEGLIPTWYSAATLLGCAALLLMIGWARRGHRFWKHWIALGLVFAFISMDEASSFHEEVGGHLQEYLGTTGMLANAWMIPAALFVAVFGFGMLKFVMHLPMRSRVLFVLAGGLYVGGALGMEFVSTAYLVGNDFQMQTTAYACMATIEELLEMTGVVVFIYALLDHAGRARLQWPTETISTRWFGRAALGAVAVLFVFGVFGQVSTYVLGHGRLLGFVRLFHLDGEGNITAWFSSMLLLAASCASLLIALRPREQKEPLIWWVLAIAFAFMSLDEFASLHELSSEPLRALWQTSALLHYPWILGGLAAAATVFALCATGLLRMQPYEALLLLASGAMYLSGALGVEMIGGWWAAQHGEANLAYQSIAAGEELLELLGVVLFLAVAVARLRDEPIRLQVHSAPTTTQPKEQPWRQTTAPPSHADQQHTSRDASTQARRQAVDHPAPWVW